MSINGIVRSATIGIAIYGAIRAIEFFGECKGVLKGARAALNDPEGAKEVVQSWNEVDEKWHELMNQLKKA